MIRELRYDLRNPKVDQDFAGGGLRPAGSVLRLAVGGRAGVPADAGAAVLNLTAVDPSAGGYITAWPCDAIQPNASNLNFDAGANIANNSTTKLAADGTICIFTSAPTQLIVDVAGYYPAA